MWLQLVTDQGCSTKIELAYILARYFHILVIHGHAPTYTLQAQFLCPIPYQTTSTSVNLQAVQFVVCHLI